MLIRNLIFCSLVLVLQPIKNFAQYECGAASVDSAEYRYQIGRFYECIDAVNKCINERPGYKPEQKTHAYYLLAKCYLAIDSVNKADSVMYELLMRQQNFEPDLNDPQRLRDRAVAFRLNLVSSVSKQNEDLRIAPATIIVVTQQEMLQRGYNDIIDVLKDMPGFDILTYYGQLYANIFQRGLRTSNTEKTLLLVDGIEENDLWSNFADISQQYPITSIKKVEVIYGPASTMYGPNAFCGVINIITKEPSDYIQNKKLFGVHANTGIGSYGTKYIDASMGYRNGAFSFSVTGRMHESDRPDLSSQTLWDYDASIYDNDSIYQYQRSLSVYDYKNQYLKQNNMPFNSQYYKVYYDVLTDSSYIRLSEKGMQEAIRLNKLLYESFGKTSDYLGFINPTQSYYVSAKINISDLSLGFTSWGKTEGIGTSYTDYIVSVNASHWRPAHHYAWLKYNKRINEKLLFTTFLNYRIHTIRNGSKITTAKDYSPVGGLELKDLVNGVAAYWLTTYYYEQSEQFRSEFKLLYNQSKYFSLISGIELRNSQLQGYYLTDTGSAVPQVYGNYPYSPGGNEYNVNDIGIYSQGTFLTKTGFRFTVGARMDYNQIRRGDGLGYSLSPRFVAEYIKKGWVFKAIVSKGIQNVSNYTKFNTVNITPNPSLTSESIYNYEISAGNKFSNSISADANIYYSIITDLVRPVAINSAQLQNENIGEVQVKGLETNFYYQSSNKKWQVSANYSYAHSIVKKDIDTSGKVARLNTKAGPIAPHKINAVVNYSFLKYFNINLRANYSSKRTLGAMPNLKNFNSYALVNVVLGVQHIIKGGTLQFICNNVFNNLYYVPGLRVEPILAPDKILQMGRNYAIKINYEF
ncbi:MAG TPA: TonB-dependent receptor [Chitinophagaceae bacterium]|nr:TonB-dependent receptor [Chitinophagaceae bacterium]